MMRKQRYIWGALALLAVLAAAGILAGCLMAGARSRQAQPEGTFVWAEMQTA